MPANHIEPLEREPMRGSFNNGSVCYNHFSVQSYGPSTRSDVLRAYFVKAFDHGRAIELATVSTAKQAVAKFLDALELYNRVWVSDEAGNDLSLDDLTRLAQEEEGVSRPKR